MKQAIYTYWDNSKGYHGKMLFQIQAGGIAEADEKFQQSTGIVPAKCSWIGCSVEII